jgi:hypothetical protein
LSLVSSRTVPRFHLSSFSAVAVCHTVSSEGCNNPDGAGGVAAGAIGPDPEDATGVGAAGATGAGAAGTAEGAVPVGDCALHTAQGEHKISTINTAIAIRIGFVFLISQIERKYVQKACREYSILLSWKRLSSIRCPSRPMGLSSRR